MGAKVKKTEESSYPFNGVRWLVVIALVVGAVVANSIYGDYPTLYRVLALLAIAGIALSIAVYTQQGAVIWTILKESQTELRKVVWPSRQETNQTTMIVVVLVAVTAVILWGLDAFFGWAVSMVIG